MGQKRRFLKGVLKVLLKGFYVRRSMFFGFVLEVWFKVIFFMFGLAKRVFGDSSCLFLVFFE